MKIFTFVLSLMNANHAYGFKTNNLLMNSGMGGFYKGPTPYQHPVKKSDTLYDPPTNIIDDNRHCNKNTNTNVGYENHGFYKGPTQRENKSDTLYHPPTNIIHGNRHCNTNVRYENYGFYKGPSQRENKNDTLYHPPSLPRKSTKQNTYTSGFYVGPTSCLITSESTELLYQPSNKIY